MVTGSFTFRAYNLSSSPGISAMGTGAVLFTGMRQWKSPSAAATVAVTVRLGSLIS